MLERAVIRHGKAINQQQEEEGPTERVAAVLPCGQKTASDPREELPRFPNAGMQLFERAGQACLLDYWLI